MFLFYEYRFFTLGFAWYTWILAYIGYDFMSFIIHYYSHRIRFLWCIHSVHHSPKELKASVSFRGSFAEFLVAPHLILWLPLLGFHPLQILIVEGVGQLYGVPLHFSDALFKKKSRKLRALGKYIVTPAFHRLHHAKNKIYLDVNFALTFTLWDRLFNTYQDFVEDEKPVYGVRTEVNPSNIYEAHTDEFKRLWIDIKNASSWKDRIFYIFKHPGWKPTATPS